MGQCEHVTRRGSRVVCVAVCVPEVTRFSQSFTYGRQDAARNLHIELYIEIIALELKVLEGE